MSVVRIHQGAQTTISRIGWSGGEIGKHGDIPALFMTSDIELAGSNPALALLLVGGRVVKGGRL